jgi:hypothetical protein
MSLIDWNIVKHESQIYKEQPECSRCNLCEVRKSMSRFLSDSKIRHQASMSTHLRLRQRRVLRLLLEAAIRLNQVYK